MLEFHSDIPEELGFIRISKCRIKTKSLTFRRMVISFFFKDKQPKKGFQKSSISSITNSYMRSALFWEFTVRMAFQEEFLRNFWPLKPGPIAWPETSVQIYPSTLRKIPKRADLIYIAVKVWNHESIYFALPFHESEYRSFMLTDEHRLQAVE